VIGFSHTRTLGVVLLSTFIAIVIWVQLIKNFEAALIRYNDMLMTGFFIAGLGLLLWYLVKKYFIKESL
jgi:hypothetical protein